MNRLSVQALESRQLMAGDVGMVESTLYIEGTAGNDIAEVYTTGESVLVKLQSQDSEGAADPIEQSFPADQVDRIVFEAFAGDDLLINDTPLDSIMRAGGGNDTLMGGEGNDILAAGSGDDLVLGGGGSDLLLGGVGADVLIEPSQIDDSVEGEPTEELTDSQPLNEDVSESETEPEPEETDSTPIDETMDDSGPVENNEETLADESSGEQDLADSLPDAVSEDTIEDEATGAEDSVDEGQPTEEIVEELNETEDVASPPGAESADPHWCFADAFPEGGEDEPEESGEPQTDLNEDTMLEDDTSLEPDAESEASDPTDEGPDEMLTEPTGSEILQADLEVDPEEAEQAPSEEPLGESSEMDAEPIDVVDEPEVESDNDVLFGGGGDDWLFGEDGDDTVFGGDSPIGSDLLNQMIQERLA